MDVLEDRSICTGCTACENKCPHSCIDMKMDGKGFLYPDINEETCTECNLCRIVCPVNDKERHRSNFSQKVYAVMHSDDDILFKSSSGGVFSSFAENLLKNNGVVFGVKFDDQMKVVHSYAKTKDDYIAFRGSKYVQSRLSGTFKEVKRFLKNGNSVLFTGLPCQVDGLNAYLGRIDTSNLITCDLACAGVPSPGLWDTYLEYLSKEMGSKLVEYSFRDKSHGWKWGKYWVSLKFRDGKRIIKPFGKDPYCYFFGSGLSKRECCQNCQYTNLNRCSDITIADFWTIDAAAPDFNDPKGVSEVLINTEKGDVFFKKSENLRYTECRIKDSLQPCLKEPRPINPKSIQFWDDVKTISFKRLARKYRMPTIPERIVNKVVRIFKMKK